MKLMVRFLSAHISGCSFVIGSSRNNQIRGCNVHGQCLGCYPLTNRIPGRYANKMRLLSVELKTLTVSQRSTVFKTCFLSFCSFCLCQKGATWLNTNLLKTSLSWRIIKCVKQTKTQLVAECHLVFFSVLQLVFLQPHTVFTFVYLWRTENVCLLWAPQQNHFSSVVSWNNITLFVPVMSHQQRWSVSCVCVHTCSSTMKRKRPKLRDTSSPNPTFWTVSHKYSSWKELCTKRLSCFLMCRCMRLFCLVSVLRAVDNCQLALCVEKQPDGHFCKCYQQYHVF